MNIYFLNVTVLIGLFFTFLDSVIIAQNATKQIIEGEIYTKDIREYFEDRLEIDSTDYEVLSNLGVVYQQEGDIEKSLYYFEKAVKFHPKKSRAYHNLGIINSIMGRLDNTIVNLKKAAELDTTTSNSLRQLGIIYLQNRMLNKAVETFQLVLDRDKYDTESYLGKALAFWTLKEYDKVITEINKMQSLGLRFNRMELLLADVYFKKKDYDKAIGYARIDEIENSTKAEGHYLLGVLYEMKGDKDKSKVEFEEASSIFQQNPQSNLKLSINIFFNVEIK